MSSFPVVLDACVLINSPVRDTLLRAAEHGLIQVRWSTMILDEAVSRMVALGMMSPDQARHFLAEIKEAFPEALVDVPRDLIKAMTNNVDDRHVAAAAVKASARIIITFDLSGFAQADLAGCGIEARHPDDELLRLLELSPEVMLRILSEQADALRNPVVSITGLLEELQRHTPVFARSAREYFGL